MGYTNVQADVNFYRQSLNADGIKDVTGPYTSLYEDVFRAITVTTDSVVSVTSYVGDSLSNQFLFAGTEIYGLFSSVTIHSGNAILHLAGASYISEIVNQYSASGIPLGFYEEGTQCLSQKISALLTQGVFDDASWIMVPSQYEEDWVRAFKPTSTLGDLAFTRGSDATFTDSTGVVRRSPWNLVTYSEQFNNAAWTPTDASITANAAIAPDGTMSADKLVENSANAIHFVGSNSGSITAGSYTASVFAKAAERDILQLFFNGSANGTSYANFNLTTGAVTASASSTATIESFGNGWYRCTITATLITSAVPLMYCCLQTSPTAARIASYLGNGTSGVLLWGAQLVEGTEALPYFATTDRLNVPRLDYSNADGTLSTCPRLLLEPQRTNSIRNSSMVGAVAGSPGTLPTNWAVSNLGTFSLSVIGIGTESGLPYIDVRFNGTASNVLSLINFETLTGIAASNGQTWTHSFYSRVISQPQPANSYQLLVNMRNAGGSSLGTFQQTYTPTTTLARFAQTITTNSATVTNLQAGFLFNTTVGAAYDFTIRIAAPQMELGAYATTWVPTTTTAVTRIADAASKTGISSLIGQTQGTIYAEIRPDEFVNASYIGISDGTTLNRIVFGFEGGSVNSGILLVFGKTGLTTSTITYNRDQLLKIAIGYKSGDSVLYVNGSQRQTSNTTFTATMDRIGFDSGSSQRFIGKCAQAALFPTRLTNDQLEVLTTL